MVGERVVLLRIQHLQQGAGRVAVVRRGQLVHLVQHHHRIGDATLLDAVHNPAGHRTDVGPAVATDVRFVADATQADADVLPLQGLGDAAADAGLARARRADEQQNGALLFLLQLHHGNLLDNAVFHLLQAEVVFLQHGLGLIEVNVRRLGFLPAQRGDKIQIIIEQTGLRAVLAFLFQAVQDLAGLLLGCLIHAGLVNLLLEAADIRDALRIHRVEFLLQELHLPLNRLLAVGFLVLILLRALRLTGQLRHLQVLVHHGFHDFHSPNGTILRQYLVLLLRAVRHPHGQRRRNLAHGLHALQVALRHHAPAHGSQELVQLLFHALHARLLDLRRQTLALRQPADVELRMEHSLVIDGFQQHAVRRLDDAVAVVADLKNRAVQANREEILQLEILPAVRLPARQQNHALPHLRLLPGNGAVLFALDVYPPVRNQNSIINRY